MDVTQCCRICASIVDDTSTCELLTSPSQHIQWAIQHFSLKLEEGLPIKICQLCEDFIKQSLTFQQKCEKSQLQFIQLRKHAKNQQVLNTNTSSNKQDNTRSLKNNSSGEINVSYAPTKNIIKIETENNNVDDIEIVSINESNKSKNNDKYPHQLIEYIKQVKSNITKYTAREMIQIKHSIHREIDRVNNNSELLIKYKLVNELLSDELIRRRSIIPRIEVKDENIERQLLSNTSNVQNSNVNSDTTTQSNSVPCVKVEILPVVSSNDADTCVNTPVNHESENISKINSSITESPSLPVIENLIEIDISDDSPIIGNQSPPSIENAIETDDDETSCGITLRYDSPTPSIDIKKIDVDDDSNATVSNETSCDITLRYDSPSSSNSSTSRNIKKVDDDDSDATVLADDPNDDSDIEYLGFFEIKSNNISDNLQPLKLIPPQCLDIGVSPAKESVTPSSSTGGNCRAKETSKQCSVTPNPRHSRRRTQVKEKNRNQSSRSTIHQFCCNHCTFSTVNKSFLELHITNKHIIIHRCTICNKKYKSSATLKYHIKNEHQLNNHRCKICYQIFEYSSDLSKHMKSHNSKNCNYLICTYENCLKLFKSKNKLEKHMKCIHNKNSSFEFSEPSNELKITKQKYKCSKCTKKLKTRHALVLHEMKHSEKKAKFTYFSTTLNKSQFKCSKCKSIYSHKLELKQHIKDLHSTKIQTFSCTKCLKVFKSKGGMNYHINNVHIELICKICDMTFKSKYKLKQHIINNECEYCSEEFSCPSILEKHVETCSDKVYVCDLCNHTLKHKSSMEIHVTLEHINNYFSHICKFCNEKFKTERRLKIHHREFHQVM